MARVVALATRMSVLVGRDTRLLVQGITGQAAASTRGACSPTARASSAAWCPAAAAARCTRRADLRHGRRARAGPHRREHQRALPPPAAAAAGLLRAIEAPGCRFVVCLTEGRAAARHAAWSASACATARTRLLGPERPGIVSPARRWWASCPSGLAPGVVGVASRSGTLAYESGLALVQGGLGQSTWVGIGGDLVRGLGFREVVALFEADPATHASC